jgi:hypothetical protein
MKSEERLKAWEDLDWPKPSWETFKRMMPMFKNDPLVVRTIWIKKNSGTSVSIRCSER